MNLNNEQESKLLINSKRFNCYYLTFNFSNPIWKLFFAEKVLDWKYYWQLNCEGKCTPQRNVPFDRFILFSHQFPIRTRSLSSIFFIRNYWKFHLRCHDWRIQSWRTFRPDTVFVSESSFLKKISFITWFFRFFSHIMACVKEEKTT